MVQKKNTKLGKLGETKLLEWCNSAELTCNRSLEEDVTGWDHYIEFPYSETDLPRDMQPSPIKCKIQVKSTQRKDRRLAIKVSVLKNLIDDNAPTFFLFIEFNEDQYPKAENAFLVHTDKEIIERTLKKIRQNDTAKNPKKLHQLTITITYNEKHQLSSLNGNAFKAAVESHIPNLDINEYHKIKKEIRENVGYEYKGFRFTFQAPPKKLVQHMFAKFIGEDVEPLDIKNSVIWDNRFNLENSAFEINRSANAQLTTEPNIIDKCQLSFKNNEFSPSINFSGEFVSSPNLEEIGDNHLAFKTNLFTLELISYDGNGTYTIKPHFLYQKKAPLEEIIKFFKIFNKHNINKDFIFIVKLLKEKRSIQFKLNLNAAFAETETITNDLETIKQKFSLDSEILMTLKQLRPVIYAIHFLAGVIKNKVTHIKLIDLPPDTPDSFCKSEMINVKLGEILVSAVVLFDVTKVKNNNFKVIESKILKPFIFENEIPSSEKLLLLKQDTLAEIKPLKLIDSDTSNLTELQFLKP